MTSARFFRSVQTHQWLTACLMAWALALLPVQATAATNKAKSTKTANKPANKTTKAKSSSTKAAATAGTAGAAAAAASMPAAPEPPPRSDLLIDPHLLWAFNLNAPLNLNLQLDLNFYGGEDKTKGVPQKYKHFLKEWWNVTNKRELVAMAHRLMETKPSDLHNQQSISPLFEPGGNVSKNLLAFEIQEEIRQHQAILAAHGLRGWDLARLQTLIAWGYMADVLTVQEARDLALQGAGLAHRQFTNFDDFSKSYLMGYLLWIRNFNKYDQRKKVVEQLLTQPNGVWRDWWVPDLSLLPGKP